MTGVQQVGTPDPRRRTSPIGGLDGRDVTADPGAEAQAGCLFNGEAFPQGAEVQSGDALLRCELGRWVVREAPAGHPT